MGKWLETDNITLFSSMYKIVCHIFHKVEIFWNKNPTLSCKLQASDHMQTGTFLRQIKLPGIRDTFTCTCSNIKLTTSRYEDSLSYWNCLVTVCMQLLPQNQVWNQKQSDALDLNGVGNWGVMLVHPIDDRIQLMYNRGPRELDR